MRKKLKEDLKEGLDVLSLVLMLAVFLSTYILLAV